MLNNTSKEEEIEREEGNDNVKIEVPFDPNDITINIIPRTIGQLVEKLEDHQILVPKFQRLPNLWDLKKKSRFIESLMLNLPIPLFYFDESSDDKNIWRVIDGLQRMSTLEHFILGDKLHGVSVSGNKQTFKLENLEFRTEYNGKSWIDLPRDIQRRINSNQVTINLIGKGTPDQVKYNIFSRINQGGIELKPQEIRTALFQGFRTDFIETLVSEKTPVGQAFLKATNNSVSNIRQENLDFVSRFISFFLLDYKTYEPDLDSFMTKGTKEIPKDIKLQALISDGFKNAMDLAFDIFGDDSFRKRKNINDRRKPINKPLFEIISVNFAKLSKNECVYFRVKKNQFIEKFISLQNNEKFWAAITSGTATKESVIRRHEDFEELINNFKK